MDQKHERSLNPCCRAENMITGSCYRFSVLTPKLIRMEYDPDGVFEDRPTQLAINRLFPKVKFEIYETEEYLEIITDYLNVCYYKGPFTVHSLQVKVRSECCGIYCTWRFSEPVTEGLGGTARTLDQADGEIPLEPGIQSRIGGFGVLDDRQSAIILQDSSLLSRKSGIEDLYFFGYGFAYKECLYDFFRLSGFTPLLPRYALGNWWSRFHAYTDQEYLELVERFRKKHIPLSVAVLDIDWHIRDIDNRCGKGWTGFTWNRNLFNDPEDFLAKLHDLGLRTTLNLHPAEGIQPHESMYARVAKEMGRDPNKQQPIQFDFCSMWFIQVYFQYVIHPLEAQGVDFWWLDWQQGTVSKRPGLDPLWLLNFYHFCDADRGEKRPMILSRYSGPGSHRFPVGFSGDTVISWETLKFQPYFTANAANIGYGWWSHDIGGHTAGRRDVELQARWVQFGVFSPIFRLHSTSNLFGGKEPWNYPEPVCSIISDYMRLRHRLIPYLYTMNWRCHLFGDMLVEPMYYQYPQADDAYAIKNQYQFGSELLVCPITQPADKTTGRACTTVWLPESDYFDFFSGAHYTGHRKLNVHRTLRETPVFAKAGAIVPLTDEAEARKNGVDIPCGLEIRVFGGDDGQFVLYEDDGVTKAYQNGDYFTTKFLFKWREENGNSCFFIEPGASSADFLPETRQYTVSFVGVQDSASFKIKCSGDESKAKKIYNAKSRTLSIILPSSSLNSCIEICFAHGLTLARNDTQGRLYEILNDAAIEYELKEKIYHKLHYAETEKSAMSELQAMDLQPALFDALLEVILSE